MASEDDEQQAFPWSTVKSKEPTGWCGDDVFQASLRRADGAMSVPLLPLVGLHAVPHIGIYGDDYEPFPCLVLLELDPSALLAARVPPDAACALMTADDASTTEAYLMIHGRPDGLGRTQCSHFACHRLDEANVMLAAWCFAVDDDSNFCQLDASCEVSVGLFAADGVQPVHHEDWRPLLHRGVPFDSVEPRLSQIHGGAFSPCNNQLIFDQRPDVVQHAFWLFAAHGRRRVLSYHLCCATPAAHTRLHAAVAAASTVGQLLLGLRDVLPAARAVIERIVRSHSEQETKSPESMLFDG